jgi:mRNA-degrading endonuclease RelE of RelBE toxin-antitoxin system
MSGQAVFDRGHPAFARDVRTLERRYPNIRADIESFARLLASNPVAYRGARMPGFGGRVVYKARAISRDLQKGKSGGLRVIHELVGDEYRFVHLYSHSGSGESGKSEAALRRVVQDRLDDWSDASCSIS